MSDESPTAIRCMWCRNLIELKTEKARFCPTCGEPMNSSQRRTSSMRVVAQKDPRALIAELRAAGKHELADEGEALAAKLRDAPTLESLMVQQEFFRWYERAMM